MVKWLYTLLALTLWTTTSLATSRDICSIPSRQVQLEVDKVVPVKPADTVTQESVALVLPTDMAPSSDSDTVRNEIMDHNLKNLMQGKYIRNSAVLRSAQKVQEVMQPKMTFGSSEEGGTQHSVNMQYEAFQKVAKLKYEGFLTSDVAYAPETQDMSVAVSEEIASTQVSVEHDSKNDLSYLKLNWNW